MSDETGQGTSPEPDLRLQLAWDECVRLVGQQASNRDEVRARAASILTAASISSAFLGEASIGKTGEVAAGAWFGIGAFCVVALAVIMVLRPRKGWVFGLSPQSILTDHVEGPDTLDYNELLHHITPVLEGSYDKNAAKLDELYTWFRVGCIALAVEIVAFLIALA